MSFMLGNKVYHWGLGVSTITNVAFNLNDHTMEFTIEKLSSNNNFVTTLTGVKPDDIYKLEIGEYVVNKLTNKICKIKNVHICNKSLLVVYDGNRSEYLNFDDVRGLDKKEELEVNEMCFKVGDYVVHSMYGFGKVTSLTEYPDIAVWVRFEDPKIMDGRLSTERKVSPRYMRLATSGELIDYHMRQRQNTPKEFLNSFYGLSARYNYDGIFEEMSKYQYHKLPKIDKVIFNDPATIIFWKDGTKTVVKCHDRDYFDKEKGFAMACLKKVLGNCGHYYEEVKKWVE